MEGASAFVCSTLTIHPRQTATVGDFKISIVDHPRRPVAVPARLDNGGAFCKATQSGSLYKTSTLSTEILLPLIIDSLINSLNLFPSLAGSVKTGTDGFTYITSNDAGVNFTHASATHINVTSLMSTTSTVSHAFTNLFPLLQTPEIINLDGEYNSPVMTLQLTQLADGLFIGASVYHPLAEGPSFWSFFNRFTDVFEKLPGTKVLDFRRYTFPTSKILLMFPNGDVNVTLTTDEESSFRSTGDANPALQVMVESPVPCGPIGGNNTNGFFKEIMWQMIIKIIVNVFSNMFSKMILKVLKMS